MAGQLVMIRPHMRGIPHGGMSPGFSWRRYRKGDAATWVDIITRTLCPYTEEKFLADLRSSPHFDPRRLFFIVDEKTGKAVATGCAGRAAAGDSRHGYVHFVGVLPEYQGKGLGKAIMLLLLRSFARRGFQDAILQTDDFRLPAIATYLKCGFMPLYRDVDHRDRWQAVFRNLRCTPVEGIDEPERG